MKKIKEILLDMQLHYIENKKKWIIIASTIVGLIVVGTLLAYYNQLDTKQNRGDTEITTEDEVNQDDGDALDVNDGEVKENAEKVPVTSEKDPSSEIPSPVQQAEIVAPTTVSSPVLAPTGPKSAYHTALEENKDKSLVFDDSCIATPKELTIEKNTLVMVANNSKTQHTFTLGGKTMPLRSMHYDLAFIGTGTHTATCDGKEVATVTVK